MQARDIMSSSVITVRPQTPVVQVAAILREQKIGGVPVLLGTELVGIVTAKDLLHRHELGTDRGGDAHAWWRKLVGRNLEPDWYVKSHGRCARHVMTRRVLVVTPDTPLRAVASLFDAHRIGRAPVVEHNRVVGIVTCSDLVKTLAARPGDVRPAMAVPGDEDIRAELLAELKRQDWWNDNVANVFVQDGAVLFTGYVETEGQREASHVAAENVAGVRSVRDERRLAAELPAMF
jgi:CBS domain-containing protein